MQEAAVLLRGGKAHHALDASTVVPRTVKDDDLACCRQLLHIALEVPLTRLAVRRLRQRLHTALTRVEVLGDALNCGALARSVTPLHNDHNTLAVFDDPLLHRNQLSLEAQQLLLIGITGQLRRLFSLAHRYNRTHRQKRHNNYLAREDIVEQSMGYTSPETFSIPYRVTQKVPVTLT